jgi:ribulose-5-phosphate 4-epimerase/fuculose-1-phosphate aldolase
MPETVVPIRDMSQVEWRTRVDLAAGFRLVDLYGWSDMLATHLSARIPGTDDHFLINPVGWMFEEMTASCLVKVDIDGNILSDSEYGINPAGYTIHSAVHIGRPDAGCVMHTHTAAGLGVATQKDGLLPLTQITTMKARHSIWESVTD